MDYIQCVLLISRQQDIGKVDFTSVLSSHQVVSVNVAASATSGKPLATEEFQNCLEAASVIA